MKRLFFALAATFLLQATAWAQTDLALDEKAQAFMEQGREALSAGKAAAAYEAFNAVLLLPPNRYSRDAQEYAGLARERAGNINAARREYELYLRLYPDGDSAERVRQRLANLAPVEAAPKLRAIASKPEVETSLYSGISQYYYNGNSHIETNTTVGSNTTTDTLDSNDQSSLVSNIDLTGRYRGPRFDNRVVFRNTNTLNFTEGSEDQNRVNAAYVETHDRQIDYAARLGRQPGYHGGILGRFDGALLTYQALPKARFDVTAGQPVDYYSHNDKSFYGANIELGTFAEHWGGALYAMQQEVDGISDREAIGGELRYFDTKRSLYSLVDYDHSYEVMNIAMVHGSWQSAAKTTYNLLFDRRKIPSMQTSNALLGDTVESIKVLLQTLSEEEIRRYAEARTATATLALAGISQPLSPKWQIGGDVRFSETSGTRATGTLPAIPGAGKMWTYTAQAIGTGLFSSRDSTIFAASLFTGDTYDGYSAFVTNRTLRGSAWAFDTALRWYHQEDNFSTTLSRLTPTVRVAYRITEGTTVEAEVGYEQTNTEGEFSREKTDRTFFFAGYRWDFW